MNSVFFHLILNHIPVIGLGFGLLLMIWGLFRKNDEVKGIALSLFVLAALFTIPVYLTGEPAEEIVEDLAGVSEAIIEQHESAAFYALIFMEITGILALLNLLLLHRTFARKILIFTSLSSIIAVVLILWTAKLGGEVRHTEIRADSTQTINSDKNRKNDHEKNNHDDDDDDH